VILKNSNEIEKLKNIEFAFIILKIF